MRAEDQTKWQATVSACLEYLALASHPSPLAQLAREALMRELNRLQIEIGRGLHLVKPRESLRTPLFDEPGVIDTAPQVLYAWSAKDLADAAALLPEDVFPGHVFDAVGQQIAGRAHVGLSLLGALEVNGVVEPVAVNPQGEEDLRGPFLRFRKV